ncbi:MAG: lysophospholipid acyltransferase family protein [Alphaproteobacteria bacterium]
MKTIIASVKFIIFALLCCLVVPLQSLILLFHTGKGAYILPFLWQKCVSRLFRIKVVIHGTPLKSKQTIFMSNHISYLDIPVIGSVLPASFVAKKDVASWPVFGFLSKLQQTAFISRERADASQAKHALDTMLNNEKSLIIFPEGTSTDGREVIPFKSSLFSLALKDNLPDLMIQPITLNMDHVDKRPINTQEDRDLYAWHIEMDTPLADHLWRFAKSKGAQISLTFHEPIRAQDFSDRKTLAKACHNTVSNGLKNKTDNS